MPATVKHRWNYQPVDAEASARLVTALQISQVLAELLVRAGWADPDEARRFLQPRLAELEDPFRIVGIDQAVTRLRRAIALRESLVILGDYDVDGVSSTAFLVAILRQFGLDPRFIVPLRLEEGYGLSRNAIDRALEAGVPNLFVALDCGTNSCAEVAYLRSRGADVVIVDHHRSKEAVPEDAILINPHVSAATAAPAWQNLCTVGLVFKLVHALLKAERDAGSAVAQAIKLRDYLDLVAMGTVADLVPLLGENRILAKHGLSILEQTARPGLLALMEVSGIDRTNGLQPVDISFRLGPRINASGRLADAALSVELILSQDNAFCRDAARQLDGFNRERQDIERRITEDAERQVEQLYAADHGIVLYDDNWHPGVVGIVASRVSRKFNRPCIVLGREGELAKGSGRSVFGVSLVDALGDSNALLSNWGGHPMAVGVSLDRSRVTEFRGQFNTAVAQRLAGRELDRAFDISAWVDLESIDEHLMGELALLHPFGQGNPKPVFAVAGAVFAKRPEVFKDQHFRFQLDDDDGRRLFGVAWKMADRLPPAGRRVDLAFELVWNHFNGRKLLQLELLDWRLAK
ncbi:MAG TPA: single-stranded-DNA-specific exonuclease RecJ [Opitutaceae bacterium]|nr:single-stranded-DNA-specific exonuclease RecJ [Opitutaceae bacterium]